MKLPKTFLIVAVVVASSASMAQTANYSDTAQILDVQIQTQRYNQPQQVCNQAPVAQQPQERSVGGAILGTVAGGLLGHTVGKGTGKTAATAIGAATGAIVGDRMQNSTTNVPNGGQSCHVVDNWIERQSGAMVTYNYQGRTFTEYVNYVPSYRAGDTVALQVRASLQGR